MATSSPLNPSVKSLNFDNQQTLKIKPITTTLREKYFKALPKWIVDFESLKANRHDLRQAFDYQGWLSYFEMLNGPTYTNLVKDLWVRVEVFNKYEVDKEFQLKQSVSEEKKGMTRHELGLKEFIKTRIRSVVQGIDVRITQFDITKLIKCKNRGVCESRTTKKSGYTDSLNMLS